MKDATVSVSIGHGKYNFPGTSGTVYVSAIEDYRNISTGFITPSKKFKENSAPAAFHPIHATRAKELGGFSTGKTLKVPNGTLLKVVSNRKVNGIDYYNACVIVFIHERCGYLDIFAKLPAVEHSLMTEVCAFNGSGMVLSAADLEGLGLSVSSVLRRVYMNQEEIEEAFDIVDITKNTIDISELYSIKSPDGGLSLSIKQAPKRRIILAT